MTLKTIVSEYYLENVLDWFNNLSKKESNSMKIREKKICIYFVNENNCEKIGNGFDTIPFYKIKLSGEPYQQSGIDKLRQLVQMIIQDYNTEELYFDTCNLTEHQLNIVSLVYVETVCFKPSIKYYINTGDLLKSVEKTVNGILGGLKK